MLGCSLERAGYSVAGGEAFSRRSAHSKACPRGHLPILRHHDDLTLAVEFASGSDGLPVGDKLCHLLAQQLAVALARHLQLGHSALQGKNPDSGDLARSFYDQFAQHGTNPSCVCSGPGVVVVPWSRLLGSFLHLYIDEMNARRGGNVGERQALKGRGVVTAPCLPSESSSREGGSRCTCTARYEQSRKLWSGGARIRIGALRLHDGLLRAAGC
ncbi:hypothetical protein NITHO_4350006 [Nitrolancea hollandica Lb]|uniref:Uncharacterized protein n=1 Tax=Nitrolancea hollandica Lb TaxID=1129897 RepID=I4EK16_9BACT|nr:hypothetical protein NITHO_4350006 [Nitrolancea hollandica Lb]